MSDRTHLDEVISRLAAAYHKQLLVPFIGAGMSVPTLKAWKDFVEAIAKEAGTWRAGDKAHLTERSHAALIKLRRGRAASIRKSLLNALKVGESGELGVTAQTGALAQLRWPLVISTNYDDLFVRAAQGAWPCKEGDRAIDVVGRSRVDCGRVLASLSEPARPMLWAIHGFLGKVKGLTDAEEERLANEAVVGYEEYRRVLHQDPHFRRAFAEVLRSRSILFLGCGIGDPDIISFLDETLALVGPSSRQHFAVIFRNEEDHEAKAALLKTRLHVEPVLLGSYEELTPEFLRPLAQRARANRPAASRWAYDVTGVGEVADAVARRDVEVWRGSFPDSLPDTDALLVSAGYGTGPEHAGRYPLYFSEGIRKRLRKEGGLNFDGPLDGRMGAAGEVLELGRTKNGGGSIWAAVARGNRHEGPPNATDARDARVIPSVVAKALLLAREKRVRRLHCQLLAAGTSSPFLPRVSLAQMLKGFAATARTTAGALPRMVIHVVDEELLADIASGRMDLSECLDDRMVRCWVEVGDSDGPRRHQEYRSTSARLSEIAEEQHVTGSDWHFTVEPSPARVRPSAEPVAQALKSTLDEIGVLPGSTLRFFR